MTASFNINLIEARLPKVDLPAVLSIAGSDSSGGAGIEADVKTISAHKAYALTCITALTAQNTSGVTAVVETPKEHLHKILRQNFEDFVEGYDTEFPLKVVKTGMLTQAAAEVLVDFVPYLKEKNIKLVVDPVMVATSGTSLTKDSVIDLCIHKIIPGAFLCTPNFVEAQFLWQSDGIPAPKVICIEDFKLFVLETQKRLQCKNLLVKGGHILWRDGVRFEGDPSTVPTLEIVDILYQSEEDLLTSFSSSYITSNNSHGTGCTLASSIASNISNGVPIERAVALSIHYVHKGMSSVKGKLGHGRGSLNHTVTADLSIREVIEGTDLKSRIKKNYGTLFNYLKTHELVKDSWANFTRHRFLSLLATNKLPFEDFLFYLKQDFYYLVTYARMHGVAISLAPDCEQIQVQSQIVTNIMTEIEGHKKKLLTVYNIDYNTADLDYELQPAPACLAYCDYLTKVGKSEDFLGIKTALAPCLHGYAEAGVFGKKLREAHDGSLGALSTKEQSNIYSSWLEDYTSEWYAKAHENGIKALDLILEKNLLSEQRLLELCQMFRDVTNLEVAFWDEVIDRASQRSHE